MSGRALWECLFNAGQPGPYAPWPILIVWLDEITIGPPYASPSFLVSFKDNRFKGKLWIYGHSGLTRKGLTSDWWDRYDAPDNRQRAAARAYEA